MIKWLLEKLGFIAPKMHQVDLTHTETTKIDTVIAEPVVPVEPAVSVQEQPTMSVKRVRKARQSAYLKQRKKTLKSNT